MKFGTEKVTTWLDDQGSTLTIETNIRNGNAVKPIRKYYEIRERVNNKKEEMAEYLKFTDSLDETKKEPSFKLEHTKDGDEHGYWYVLKCWTVVSYE